MELKASLDRIEIDSDRLLAGEKALVSDRESHDVMAKEWLREKEVWEARIKAREVDVALALKDIEDRNKELDKLKVEVGARKIALEAEIKVLEEKALSVSSDSERLKKEEHELQARKEEVSRDIEALELAASEIEDERRVFRAEADEDRVRLVEAAQKLAEREDLLE